MNLDHEHTKTVRSIAFNESGSMVALGSFDSTISIWKFDEDSGYDCITILEGHENEVKSVEFHPHENLLSSASRDKLIWIWDYDEDLEFECFDSLSGHSNDVKMARWIPSPNNNSKELATASYDESIKIWDLDEDQTYYCKQTINCHSNIVWALVFNSLGTIMVSASEDKTMRVFERQGTGEEFQISCTLSGYHERAIYSIDLKDYSEDEYIVASVGGDDTLAVYKLMRGDMDTMTHESIAKEVKLLFYLF